jgi:hypothetical protein
VNWQQLRALVWLRWRLMVNQWRRAGTLNAVLMTVFAVCLVSLAIPLFIGCLVAGLTVIPKAQPAHLLYAWDGLVIGFLFFWMTGLLTELQRTEPLSLMKFLHLPVSVNGAFLINYLTSLVRLSLILFLPMMVGFCLALVIVKGAALLIAWPLLAAFVLMITAVTYQFQGWLASLMTNPRRRRTVVVVSTTLFVLVMQAPNLLNWFGFWGAGVRADRAARAKVDEEVEKLRQLLARNEIDVTEFMRRQEELTQQHDDAKKQANRDQLAQIQQMARLANQVLPIGWLPLGVMSAAEGRPLPAILGCLGMTLIGSASLWRAYRTTVRLYLGEFNSGGSKRPVAVAAKPSEKAVRQSKVLLLERRLPGVSEPVSAIALGTLRSLLRSPEAKMMMLTLVIFYAIGGAALLKAPLNTPALLRPLFAIAGMLCVMFGVLQFVSNQFGFDRDGFRVFVLCPASRRDILLGKNLGFAIPTLATAAVAMVVVQFVTPMRIDHFLAVIPLYVSMYLLYCVMANLISIFAPLYIAPGSFKPANPKLKTVLLQMLLFMVLFPLAQIPTLLPLGIEAGAEQLGWTTHVPIFLLLSLVECAVIVWLYRLVLDWQGDLLQRREQRILEIVTNK